MVWLSAGLAALCVWLAMSDHARMRALGGPARRRLSLPAWLPELPRRADVRRRERLQAELPEALELMAAALEAGLPPRTACAEVARSGPRTASQGLASVAALVGVGVPDARAWTSLADDPDWADATREMARSVQSGAGAAQALRRLAEEARSRRRDAVTKKARAVGVRAVWPLMACYLPAFLLVGVVPIVAGLVRDLIAR